MTHGRDLFQHRSHTHTYTRRRQQRQQRATYGRETVEWRCFHFAASEDNEEAMVGFKLSGATPPATRELAAQHSRGCGPRHASPTLRQREVEDRRLSNTRTVEGC